MISSRIRAGVRAGLVAAAATAGAIIGFGIRHGDWVGPFTSLGTQVTQGLGVTGLPRSLATVAGLVAHASWMVIWGITFAALSHQKTPVVSAIIAALVGVVAALAAASLVPAALGAVRFAMMPGVQAALCVALMSAGLVMGRALSGGH